MKPRPWEFDWTPERIALLERWWSKEGLSGSEIGRRLGTSKCSAVGKAHRLGFKRARSTAQIKKEKGRAAELCQAHRKAVNEVKVTLPAPPKPVPAPLDARLPFIAARFGQCLYPLWEFPAKTGDVCGAKTGGGPFCAFHERICHRSVVEARAGLR